MRLNNELVLARFDHALKSPCYCDALGEKDLLHMGINQGNTNNILLPAHPASFAHNFVSGMQSFYFSESQDSIVLQTCH